MKVCKYFLFVIIFLNAANKSLGLQCYECFWSDTETDYDEEHEESEEMKELKYPKVNYFFDKRIKATPTRDQVSANCKKKTCDPGQWCMKYTLKSSHPKKITRMCIGNPKQRSGCYQQVVELKDSKDAFLTKEACLCSEENLCNTATSLLHSVALILFSIFFSIVRHYITLCIL